MLPFKKTVLEWTHFDSHSWGGRGALADFKRFSLNVIDHEIWCLHALMGSKSLKSLNFTVWNKKNNFILRTFTF